MSANSSPPDNLHFSVLGGGEIGLCMAAVLADAGVTVELAEPDGQRRVRVYQRIVEQMPKMETACVRRKTTSSSGSISHRRWINCSGGRP